MGDLSTWVRAILTVAAFSFVWKENPAFRLAEHLFVGVTAGNSLVIGLRAINTRVFERIASGKNPMSAKVMAVIGLVMGLLLFTRFIRPLRHLRTIPASIILGVGAGVGISGAIVSQGTAQLKATILPLNSIDNVIIMVACLTTMVYFYYSAPKSKLVRNVSLVGRYMMMIGFGAAYGNTVMSRITLLADQMLFLAKDWLHILK